MESIGRIIGISDFNIKVILFDDRVKIGDILVCMHEGRKYRFEVVEINANIATTIPFERVIGLKKGIELGLEERRSFYTIL